MKKHLAEKSQKSRGFPYFMERLFQKMNRYVSDAVFYRQGDLQNILIISSRRSGSTYLSKLVCSNSGTRFIDQPFDLFRPHTDRGQIKKKNLPSVDQSQFISFNGNKKIIMEYTSSLLSGKLKPLGVFPRSHIWLPASRTVIKICNASSLINWFGENFDVQILFLIRHPIAQACSVMNQGWGITSQAFLNNSYYVNRYLNPKQINYAEKIIAEGSYFQNAVLNWIFENYAPLFDLRIDALIVTYEELVMKPFKMVNFLSKKLVLKEIEAMLELINKPSQSEKFIQKKKIEEIEMGNRLALISGWVDEVSDQERDEVGSLLELFGISAYNSRQIWPDEKMLHFNCDNS